MGAWGNRNFENDGAIDWLNDFLAKPSENRLKEVFHFIVDQEEFIDSDESFEALAAAEIVAAQKGAKSEDFPKEIADNKFSKVIDWELLTQLAIKVVDKILHFPGHSELRELWLESDEYEQWVSVQQDLIERLRGKGD
ncbi:hypothetical protein AY601_1793 [Pedobacter cryoconitis]|uniref:DUF4259 domain-containing protein n=1 Tax=Pedobacter cryoconitis TaxID=188932 RepID=A0A127VBM2_9SPHI|nr:DUF4259 domain-containing protein [Pedobacter cryoconitis]AMP98704.1 hypothetical protein AY601_1793 [Pedobacter cryoconitis]